MVNLLRFTDFGGFTAKIVNGRQFKSWDCFDMVEHFINKSGGLKIPINNDTIRLKCDIGSKKRININNKEVAIRKISFSMILKYIAKELDVCDTDYEFISSNMILTKYKSNNDEIMSLMY